MRIKGNVLTEKGMVKPSVRKTVVEYITANPEVFADAEKVEGKNVYTLAIEAADATIYANFDLAISVKPACERAEKKPSTKAKAEPEAIEIE